MNEKRTKMAIKLKSAEHLEEHEVNKLLRHLYQQELWQYYLLVRIGISTALRYSDLSKITWGDILKCNGNLLIKEQKTGKHREIPIPKDLITVVADIYHKANPTGINSLIFLKTNRGVNKQLKLYAAKAGIRGKRISTHTFRKTFGREVWKRNNCSEESLVKLSQLFRHSSIATTRIYLSITQEEVKDLYSIQDFFVY